MIIIDKNAAGLKVYQGASFGSAIPVFGDLQKLISAARRRREPVYERVNGQYTRI